MKTAPMKFTQTPTQAGAAARSAEKARIASMPQIMQRAPAPRNAQRGFCGGNSASVKKRRNAAELYRARAAIKLHCFGDSNGPGISPERGELQNKIKGRGVNYVPRAGGRTRAPGVHGAVSGDGHGAKSASLSKLKFE